ncbi:hypothetical protein SAMN05216227_102031 [Pseudorhodobacter antarcticus]|uniref:Uncharacterized protein n=1 Tax=Pseudorhodobacter antarcticus TaxID=1077947 RepID=A0A1H8IGH6_9RHOB|nr:hypothetical protein SAMN05216227_102031 [Pseudorhodobacter antarcticus]
MEFSIKAKRKLAPPKRKVYVSAKCKRSVKVAGSVSIEARFGATRYADKLCEVGMR